MSPAQTTTLHRDVRYPQAYTWFVFLSACDVLFTWLILGIGGQEVNWVAKAVIENGGLHGLIAFKFLAVTFIVLVCEFLGQLNAKKGRRVAEWAVALTSVPVIVAATQLAYVHWVW